MVHVTCADAALGERIPDRENCIRWQDDLTVGPVPATETLEDLTAAREVFWQRPSPLSRFNDHEIGRFQPRLWERDARLRGVDDSEEIVLWCGPNRRELLMLAAFLNFFPATFPRVSVAESPRESPFCYNTDQLARFYETRSHITPERFRACRELWRSYTAADPAGLAGIARQETDGGIAKVAAWVLEDYPSLQNGLSRNEEDLLRYARAEGSVVKAVAWTMAESDDLLGDLPLFERMWAFLSADAPLLAAGTPLDQIDTWPAYCRLAVQPAPLGTQVMNREADYVRVNGIDRWIGGVHLQGRSAPWRFDRLSRRLISD